MVEDTSYAPRMDHNARRDLMQKLARTETPQAAPSRSQPYVPISGAQFDADKQVPAGYCSAYSVPTRWQHVQP
jgi:hypothetical protein